MRQGHLRRALLTLASLAGFIGCGGDGAPTSPPGATGVAWAAVSAGFEHTCGLTTAGAAYCWGYNVYGQLGVGTTTGPESCPTANPDVTVYCSLAPAPVAGGIAFAAVSAGAEHSCGVTAAGAAYCWGYNYDGKLGDGTTTQRLTPVRVASDVRFATVGAGNTHSCGVTDAGVMYCWGFNGVGEVGDGTTTKHLTPVLAAGGLNFAAVGLSAAHNCGVTAAGAAYCWGSNSEGELGDGTTTQRLTPVLVASNVRFAALARGIANGHTCGVTAAGAAYCWGSNRTGQLGDGTTTQRLTPVPVASSVRFTAVSAGSFHTCGLTAAGAAYCWGGNGAGQLGDGTGTDSFVPVPSPAGRTPPSEQTSRHGPSHVRVTHNAHGGGPCIPERQHSSPLFA